MRAMKTPLTNYSTIEFWELVTHDLKDIVKSVVIDLNDEIPDSSISKITMRDSLIGAKNPSRFERVSQLNFSDWSKLAWLSFGFCYMFKIPEEISNIGIHSVTFNLKINTYIYIHHLNHFYFAEENKALAKIGKRSYLSFTHEFTRLLENSKGSLCSDELNESYDSCILENLEKAMEEKFGCHFFNSSNHDLLCNGRNVKDQYKNDFGVEFHHLFRKVRNNFCPKPCETLGITYGIPVESDNEVENEALIRLYFKQQISSRKSAYSYEYNSVIADIGGYLGLLLGFSILDVTLVIEKILIRR